MKPALPSIYEYNDFRKFIADFQKAKYEHDKPTSSSISTEEFVRDEVLKQFQIKSLELAKSAILNNSTQSKVIATNTISVSMRGQKRIEKQIDRFRLQIRSLVHKDEDPPETVYQINVLFFPMMK